MPLNIHVCPALDCKCNEYIFWRHKHSIDYRKEQIASTTKSIRWLRTMYTISFAGAGVCAVFGTDESLLVAGAILLLYGAIVTILTHPYGQIKTNYRGELDALARILDPQIIDEVVTAVTNFNSDVETFEKLKEIADLHDESLKQVQELMLTRLAAKQQELERKKNEIETTIADLVGIMKIKSKLEDRGVREFVDECTAPTSEMPYGIEASLGSAVRAQREVLRITTM